MAAVSGAGQGAPKKRKIKTVRVVDGHEVEVEVEVDDTGAGGWKPRADLRLLNHALPRVDGPQKVSGRARFTHDVRLPGMVWARLLLAPRPRGAIQRLDLDAARAVPGVVAAIALQDERVTWLGQPLAAVAAESVEAADDGVAALAAALALEPEPWALDHANAIRPDAPKVARAGNVSEAETKGDEARARAALDGAVARVSARYVVPVQHHACLETHGVVVDYRGGDEATVYCSTQHTFSFVEDAARVLGLPVAKVTGIVEHMGGGFGGKFGLGSEGRAACLLAKELKRPVHLMLTRRDEFLMAGNRSGTIQDLELGADAAGRLVGLVATADKLGGLGRGSLAGQPYVYSVGESYRSVRSVRTHLDANRAMRAPGHPQASFAIESAIDELAWLLAMDPLELRKKNLRDQAWLRQLERCAREIGWDSHPHRTKPGTPDQRECIGIGFGVATWGGGGNDACHVELRIERDGSVAAEVGSQDLGTGTRTYLAAIVAEELGLELAGVEARIGSTRYGNANPSGGSTTAASLAPAAQDAAVQARLAFAAHLEGVTGDAAAGWRFTTDGAEHTSGRALDWRKACGTLPAEGLRAQGRWVPDLQASGVHGAQAAQVRVDPGTGRVEVLHMVCVQDLGLPLNRMAVESQIRGGMIQALGYALLEGRVVDPTLGLQLNASLEDYKLPHALEIPRMTVVIDDQDERQAVIGVGEPPVIPGAGAIANAVHNACGARVRELPITPDKVLRALGRCV